MSVAVNDLDHSDEQNFTELYAMQNFQIGV